jgi:hypothetical protein
MIRQDSAGENMTKQDRIGENEIKENRTKQYRTRMNMKVLVIARNEKKERTGTGKGRTSRRKYRTGKVDTDKWAGMVMD